MPEPDDASDVVDLGQERIVRRELLRPAGEVHARRRVAARLPDEHLPEVLGEERHHRGDDAERLDERVPEHAKRDLVAVPEATARAADVPVRDVGDVRLERLDDVDRQPALAGGRLADESPSALDEPRIERLELAGRAALEVAVPGREALDVRVLDEERGRVPERQEPPLDLVRRAEAEEEVAVGRLRAELPAHHVGAHARERVRRVDRVPPRAVHLAAVLVEHLLVAEHLAETAIGR